MQLNGFIRVIDFRLSLYARIGITVAAEQLLNAVFHFGDLGTAIEIAWLNFGQRFDFSRMPRQVTTHLNTRKLVLIAFSDVDRNVDAFLVRRQTHLSRVDIETRVTTIQIVAAQGFKVARQFLFLVFTIAHHVPPRHFIAQLEGGDQFVGAERVVTHNVDLLDLRRDTFLEDQLQVNTVTRQRSHNRFHAGAVFTDAVVEVFQTFFNV